MFRINIPITKSTKSSNGKLIVKGVASDPTIDRDQERFDTFAIQKMENAINGGNIPIRIEHENKFYTEVGIWKSASINSEYKLEVEGEVDTELSFGKDVETLLGRGAQMALSVGGKVLDASYEYNQDLGKNIRVYKDVDLNEISIVKNPSNYNVTLEMAKSVDWNKVGEVNKSEGKERVVETTQAQEIANFYRNIKPVSSEQFAEMDKCGGNPNREKRKANVKMAKSWNEVYCEIEGLFSDEVTKCGYASDFVSDYDGLSMSDMQVIIQVTKFLDEVEIPETMLQPAELQDPNFLSKLPEEAYIVLANRELVLPHHNMDLSLNKDFLAYTLKSLFDGKGYWRPKEYSIAVNHLYHHLKEASMLKQKPAEKSADEGTNFSDEQLLLMKSAYEYTMGISKEVPVVDGQALDMDSMLKMTGVYKYLTSLVNKSKSETMDIKKDEVAEETPATEIKSEETKVEETPVVETPVVETPAVEETPVVETPVVETPAEVTPAEVAPVEQTLVVEEKPAEEPATEKVEVAEEAKPVTPEPGENTEVAETEKAAKAKFCSECGSKLDASGACPKCSAKKSEDDKAEEDDTEKGCASKKKTPAVTKKSFGGEDFVTKAEMSAFNKSINDLQKSVNDLSSKLASAEDTKKTVTSLQNDVANVAKAIGSISEYVTARKSVRSFTALEKTFTDKESNEATSVDELVKTYMEKGMSFQEAYKKAKSE